MQLRFSQWACVIAAAAMLGGYHVLSAGAAADDTSRRAHPTGLDGLVDTANSIDAILAAVDRQRCRSTATRSGATTCGRASTKATSYTFTGLACGRTYKLASGGLRHEWNVSRRR